MLGCAGTGNCWKWGVEVVRWMLDVPGGWKGVSRTWATYVETPPFVLNGQSEE